MTNLSSTIIAKSDQLNSDDLIGRNLTIKITKVSLLAGEQPVAIHYEGDEGKPWKPCKSMRRVLIGVWGSDGNAYVGRSLTLYRDEKVLFGGVEVGGIRISHMSNIESQITMSLTASKAKKKPFVVKPLIGQTITAAPKQAAASQPESENMEALKDAGRKEAESGVTALKAWWTGLGATKQNKVGGAVFLDELKAIAANPAPTVDFGDA